MSNYIWKEGSHWVQAIRGWHGRFHLLGNLESRELVLIDTGLVGELPQLDGVLKNRGREWGDLKVILLTHGHLDHTGNLAALKEQTGARLFAHPLERLHIEGTFPYRGASRLCGWMEALGRGVIGYRSVAIDESLVPGVELPFWGGLKVIHLPGHTAGHCGFYSARFGLLFPGDLFADYGFSTHVPPPFLNSCAEKIPGSLRTVVELAPRLIVPNHYGRLDPKKHARNFRTLAARYLNSSP